jgi:hypothetical protein
MQQQQELQRAMEEQLMLQGQGSDGDGDSWA